MVMGKIPQLPRAPSLPKVIPFYAGLTGPETMSDSAGEYPPLSSREKECLFHIARGMTVEDIAITLQISDRSVEKYIRSARVKFGAKTREEAIAIAVKNNFL